MLRWSQARGRDEGLVPSDPTLLARLETAVPGGVAARAADRLSFSHDASHYVVVPQAVVAPRTATEVAALLRASADTGIPLTFRSAGTSLSGQATNDGVLVDTRRHFRGIEVLDDGAAVRVRPGETVRAVNARLARYSRKLGPDPASESTCTIGGVVANNSSGMACGIELNSYRTLRSAVLVLPSGTVLDTGLPDADERLRALEPATYAGLEKLRDRVRDNPAAVETIRRLYAIKNTMGYGVNSFVDHTRPIDILAHLVVGSEGTLAFVAEATFTTVPAHRHAATGLLLFRSLAAATAALPALVDARFAAIELLDATSLRVAQRQPNATPELSALLVEQHAAFLVEYQEATEEVLEQRVSTAASLLREMPAAGPVTLTSDAKARGSLWSIRKGLYAAVAGARPPGTTALLEDIAVPVEALLDTCNDLTTLFKKHGYDSSVVFGHAKHGNLHFLLNEDFDRPELVQRYLAFTEDMVELVIGRGGTLKAEHGTGRIMAPFVRRQYGDELYAVMKDVKGLLDPRGLLNPGVLIADDPVAHVSHLKSVAKVEPEVDRCVECGYCEPVCPSADLTMTPRQRIVVRREIGRARASGDFRLARTLEREYRYDGVETCAVDGMCQVACPVLIDTGDLTRRLRGNDHGRLERAVWLLAARHWRAATTAAAAALTAARAMPSSLSVAVTAAGRALFGTERVPAWSPELPRGGRRRRPLRVEGAQAVYFPACISTVFGAAAAGGGVRDAFLRLCDRAGVPICIPEQIAALCCGTPWKSKGLVDGHDAMRDRVVPILLRATDGGRLPVVVDATSCTEGLIDLLAHKGVVVVDAVEFVASTLVPHLRVRQRVPALAVHATCSSTRLGVNAAARALAAFVAEQVIEPEQWSCCAFAGDRGLLHPELTAAATAREAESFRQIEATAYASVNRTCELGMTRATGHTFHHLLELVADATVTRPCSRR